MHRICEQGLVQTLKADRAAGVAANRAEWEWPVKANLPELNLLTKTSHWRLPPDLDLQPVFVTAIDRTVRTIQREDGTEIEVAFDEGMIFAGYAHQPVCELELELRQGNLSSLLQWAIELHATVPLMIESETKAQRGYRLSNTISTLSNDSAQKPKDVAPSPDTPAAKAFQHMVTSALGHLLANQPASLAGETHGLRQMRLAFRRLRAVLTLFKPYLKPDAALHFRSELQRINRFFKDARDWNTFCRDTLPNAMPDDTHLHPLATAAREAAYHDLIRELRAPPFTVLVLGLAAWVEQDALTDPARFLPLSQIASPLLQRLAEKLDKRGRLIERQSDVERHALRKSLRNLHYGVRYLAAVYPEHAADAWLFDCVSLQRRLRRMDNATQASTMAARLKPDGQPALVQATATLSTQLHQRPDDTLPDLTMQWNKLQASSRFWA